MIRRGFRIVRRLVNDPHGSSREIARRLARRIERFAGSASGMTASRQPTAEPTRDDNMSLELYSLRSKLRLSDGRASSLMVKLASTAPPATQIAPATQEISMLHDEAVLQVYSARAAECRLLTTIERERERLESIESYVEECQKALVLGMQAMEQGMPNTQT
jgi:hypothetical protein